VTAPIAGHEERRYLVRQGRGRQRRHDPGGCRLRRPQHGVRSGRRLSRASCARPDAGRMLQLFAARRHSRRTGRGAPWSSPWTSFPAEAVDTAW